MFVLQVMVSIMYRRPRYDVEAPYFIRTYINECQILAQWTTLTQEMANMTVRISIWNFEYFTLIKLSKFLVSFIANNDKSTTNIHLSQFETERSFGDSISHNELNGCKLLKYSAQLKWIIARAEHRSLK